MSDRRKREIRKLMAETGMNYTRAAREVERRRSADNPSPACPVGARPASAEISRAAEEHARLMARIGDPGPFGRQIAEISRAAEEHARQMARIGDPGPFGRQIAEISRAAEEHARQISEVQRQANVFRVRFTPPV